MKKITILIGLMVFCFSNVLCFAHSYHQHDLRQSSDVDHPLDTHHAEDMVVVTTLFPTYDFAKQIGKDKVDVTLLLPPGVEAHAYEPKPKDIVKINSADVFVYTGEFMEPWAEDILDGVLNDNLVIVDSSEGVELMDEADHDDHHAEGHHGVHAFEWAGAFGLSRGEYKWTFAKVDGDYADPMMKIVILASSFNGNEAIEEQEEKAEELLEAPESIKKFQGDELKANDDYAYQLVFDQDRKVTEFSVVIEKEGVYTFFTEHMPFEFEADEHFFKDTAGVDIEPTGEEPETGHRHHHHGGKDPHIWVDLGNAQIMVDNIANAFAAKDPENKDYYLKNAAEYKAKLADLDERFNETLSTAKHKTIIYGGHFAFGYFAKRYGLDHESPYDGFSPNAEPSPKAIAELIRSLRQSGQKYIYYEELIDPKVSRVIAEETGATLELLHGAHNVSKKELIEGITFVDIMEDNLKKLKVGLECE